ncbi:Neurosecretory protein VGF [Channa argus]|uniref:Neurosecretory protein VGF n=1 Tax=Channa argus TaxID=215402 RepID=A0A6G1Q4K2_CHAAH|nr:Neurosecretory protein VGF [Channa argus]KAK2900326.1 hypothetical protein Q8A73_013455 [Channa argus]
MTGHYDTLTFPTLLILLTGASFFHLSSPNPTNSPRHVENPHSNVPLGQTVSGVEKTWDKDNNIQSIQKEKTQEEEELFKDVDPKTLAAVLVEALNPSKAERRREGDKLYGLKENRKAETREAKKKDELKDVRIMEDDDQNGQQELKLIIATKWKEQEKEEEEERKKVQKQEEMMTEKVTSHITSQTVQVKTKKQLTSLEERRENGKGGAPQQGLTTPTQSIEEEEHLSPEEAKSLEAMIKEFPHFNTATKRDSFYKQNQRDNRGYSSYNDIIPINESSNFALSKNKLKWQEETQKALNLPTFREGNFMGDSNYGGYAVQSLPPAEQVEVEDNEPEEEEEKDEEVLSTEEEETYAKAEQEEMRRQVAEAQRAKKEEEKLADIASDMLLRYMIKQNNGKKKYSSFLPNAAEDKRSNEEQEMTEDAIDPQIIDTLIEISSKLHLPADDVVDIINDVEKKKKKVVPPALHRQKTITSLSSKSSHGISAMQISDNRSNYPISKQTSSTVNLLKTSFQEKMPTKSQDHWGKTAKPLLVKSNIWPKSQKPMSTKQQLWLKTPKSVWTGYTYLSSYRPNPDNYPIYFPPLPRTKPHYYIHKPAFILKKPSKTTFPPEHHSWNQPWLSEPPSDRHQKPYYTSYPFSLYPQTFHQVTIYKPHSLFQIPVISSQQRNLYNTALAPAVRRNKDYVSGTRTNDSNHEGLGKYIQKILMKRPQMLD